jgi:SAM-dependent methyltransferase
MMPLVEVHPFARRGFTDVADAYERGRPGYPDAAIDWLAERLPLRPGATVVDVGAGTGKLTRQLLALRVRVLAVEPLESMREVLAAAAPEAEVLAGSAEALPLREASVDAVTAGQAAHWFRGNAAASEFARVLRPGGGVGLLWNERDVDDSLQAGIEELITPRRDRAPVESWRRWRDGLERGPFTPLEQAEFRHVHELPADDVPALVSSFSYVGGLPPSERDAVLRRVRRLVAEASSGTHVRLAYRTDAYACTRL